MSSFSRRSFAALAPLSLAACVGAPPLIEQARFSPDLLPPGVDADLARHYGEIDSEPFPVPAIDIAAIDPRYLRQTLAWRGPQAPGTILVDPDRYFLTFVQDGGRAIRYGVGVGREGFGWSGLAAVRRKAEWPVWTPPSPMIARQPELEKYRNGMPGGLDNPLGARALYLYEGDRDTLYRIHGTNEPETIGSSVSSGCIRMFNQDAIDLYRRAPVGTKVLVLSSSRRPELS